MYLHCGVSKSYVRAREVTVLHVHLICVSSMRDVVMLYPNMSHCLWCIVNIRKNSCNTLDEVVVFSCHMCLHLERLITWNGRLTKYMAKHEGHQIHWVDRSCKESAWNSTGCVCFRREVLELSYLATICMYTMCIHYKCTNQHVTIYIHYIYTVKHRPKRPRWVTQKLLFCQDILDIISLHPGEPCWLSRGVNPLSQDFVT